MMAKKDTCWRCACLFSNFKPHKCPLGFKTEIDNSRHYLRPTEECPKPRTLNEYSLLKKLSMRSYIEDENSD